MCPGVDGEHLKGPRCAAIGGSANGQAGDDGQDRPGILREISHALATRGVSIEELETECLSASWSGEVIFRATAELRVPADLSTEQLREVLESLGNELMVDITLDETTSA